MTYLVLARKYRPQTFEDVIGQEHVTRTLANAFELGRVHHAYLFTGARGTGKTTCARILAKALNCEKGPSAQPDGTCSSCQEIAAGTAVDVFEIDAATHTGVDNVRELRDNARYVPTRGRYKIYVIDEVHMLSAGAFNALLKTLEEPPEHVKFIFATTEPHKIPVTILSRCQRFDFKRVTVPVLAAHIEKILAAENVKMAPEGVLHVARAAEGSVRDGLSVLDQILSFSGKNVTEAQVVEVLGISDRGTLHALASAILRRDAATCLRVVDEAFQHGRDLTQLAGEIQRLLRDLAVSRIGGAAADDLIEMGAAEAEKLRGIAQEAGADQLLRLYDAFAKTIETLGVAGAPRLALEMALLKLVSLEPLVPLDALVERLEAMERGDGSGGTGAGTGTAAGSGAGRAGGPTGGGARTSAPEAAAIPKSAPEPESVASRRQAPEPESIPLGGEYAEVGGEPGCADRAGVATSPDVKWGEAEYKALLEDIGKERTFVAAAFEHGALVELTSRKLVLAFAPGDEPSDDYRSIARAAARKKLSPMIELVFVRHEGKVPPDSLVEAERRRRAEDRDMRKKSALENPRVKDALQLFDVNDPRAVKARVED